MHGRGNKKVSRLVRVIVVIHKTVILNFLILKLYHLLAYAYREYFCHLCMCFAFVFTTFPDNLPVRHRTKTTGTSP